MIYCICLNWLRINQWKICHWFDLVLWLDLTAQYLMHWTSCIITEVRTGMNNSHTVQLAVLLLWILKESSLEICQLLIWEEFNQMLLNTSMVPQYNFCARELQYVFYNLWITLTECTTRPSYMQGRHNFWWITETDHHKQNSQSLRGRQCWQTSRHYLPQWYYSLVACWRIRN